MRGSLLIVLMCALTSIAHGRASVYLDGRDHWIIRPLTPVNHQLRLQLDQPEAQQRAFADMQHDRVAFASDGHMGMRLQLLDGSPGRYHGFYVANTFAEARMLEGLHLNINPTFYNPSASDGYRLSARIQTGIALHAEGTLTEIDGDPLQMRALLHDLGSVTIGEGLFLEEWLSEGNAVGLRWRHFALDQMMIGRALWPSDDLYSIALSAFDRAITLSALAWLYALKPHPLVSLSGDFPITSWWRTSAEVGLNTRHGAWAALLRTDLRGQWGHRFKAHLCYQGRFYEARVAPLDQVVPTSVEFNLPWREYGYVTNAAEFMGAAAEHTQLTHSLMVEGRLRLLGTLSLFTDVEGIYRWADTSALAVTRFHRLPDDTPLPGESLRWFYRAGLSWRPWPAAPHRLKTMVFNKHVIDPSTYPFEIRYTTEWARFLRAPAWALEVEVWL
ncbi:MAG: hypothetical protein ACE366_26680 [Bradymonadia bacterium]